MELWLLPKSQITRHMGVTI